MSKKIVPDPRAGDKFGRLTVVSPLDVRDKHGHRLFFLRCECGNEVRVKKSALVSGDCRSCGCFRKEFAAKSNTTHGKRYTPEYRAWIAMHSRCTNPNVENYHRYGGRCIRVCERWDDFENFFTDMGPRPSNRHSLDRIDNNGNYEPPNCRWAVSKQQSRNVATNRHITFNGETRCLTEWAELIGVKAPTLWRRIVVRKWPLSRALSKFDGRHSKTYS